MHFLQGNSYRTKFSTQQLTHTHTLPCILLYTLTLFTFGETFAELTDSGLSKREHLTGCTLLLLLPRPRLDGDGATVLDEVRKVRARLSESQLLVILTLLLLEDVTFQVLPTELCIKKERKKERNGLINK